MKQLIFATLFLGMFLTSCGSKAPMSPVSVVWEMGQNDIAPNAFESTFFITNNGTEPLGRNWVIYFNLMSAFPLNDDENAPIRTESLVASFHRMYPTEHFEPIMPGETLAFTTRHRGWIIREAQAPQGMYIVFLDDDGNELHPQTVDFRALPFVREEQWTRAGQWFPYSDGEFVFSENSRFNTQVNNLSVAHILPTPKFVEKREGTSTFSRNVNLVFDSLFENEANLLRNRLTTLFDTRFPNSDGTVVELVHLDTETDFPSEYYELTVKDGRFILTANTPHGMFNATQSLVKILGNALGHAGNLPAEIPNMHIMDYPDIGYRGFMLDVSRNFTRKENLLKLIDHLALYKISVLHLHLTDDEGWRIEIPGLPELTEVGSRRGHTLNEHYHSVPLYDWGWDANCPHSLANGYFTRQDFIDILQFAAARHIRVIPEIDIPGHARAAILAMNARYRRYIDTDPARAKEFLLIDFNDTSRFVSMQHYTDNVINVAMPSTFRFIEKVIDEIYKMYVDAGLRLEIFHVGGDEVPRGSWEGSEIALAFMEEQGMAEIRDLKDYFLERILDMVEPRGIQLAGWEEVVMMPDLRTVNKRFAHRNILTYAWNTVPDWGGDELPYRLANAGFPIILSNVGNFYMDLAYANHHQENGLSWGGYVNEFNSFDMLPFDIYRSLRRDTRGRPIDIHNINKLPLNYDARHMIKGLQAQLWTETIRSFEQIQYYIFPKMFGLIERAWNMEPAWSAPYCDVAYLEALRFYNAQLSKHELPRLKRKGLNFRVAPPGIIVRNGMLHANTQIPNAVIRFTTDGSTPNANSPIWTEPVAVDAELIKAKAFHLGKESITIWLRN